MIVPVSEDGCVGGFYSITAGVLSSNQSSKYNVCFGFGSYLTFVFSLPVVLVCYY